MKNMELKEGDRVLIPTFNDSDIYMVGDYMGIQCCNTHMFDIVFDLGSRSYYQCDCSKELRVIDRAGSYAPWVPMPTRPSRRSSYNVGEKVFVAWKCANISFRVLPISRDVPSERCCWFEGTKISYDCLYTINQVVLNAQCREAVDAWLKVALKMRVRKKMKVPKDIRLLIGTILWSSADDPVWEPHRHRNHARSSHKKIKSYVEVDMDD